MKLLKFVLLLLLVVSICQAAKKKKGKKKDKETRNCTLILTEEKKIKKNKAWKKCDKSNKLIKECVADYGYEPDKIADEYEDLMICRYLASPQFQEDWWEDTEKERLAIIKDFKKTDEYKSELDAYVPGAIMAVVEAQLHVKYEELDLQLKENYTEKYEDAKDKMEEFMQGLQTSVSSYISNLKDAIEVRADPTEMTPTSNSFHWATKTQWTPSGTAGPTTPINTASTSPRTGPSSPTPYTPFPVDSYTMEGEEGHKEQGVVIVQPIIPIERPNPVSAEECFEYIDILTIVAGDSGVSQWVGVGQLKEIVKVTEGGVLQTKDCFTGELGEVSWSSVSYEEEGRVLILETEVQEYRAQLPDQTRCGGDNTTMAAELPVDCLRGFLMFTNEPQSNCTKAWPTDQLVSEMSLKAATGQDCQEDHGAAYSKKPQFKPQFEHHPAHRDIHNELIH